MGCHFTYDKRIPCSKKESGNVEAAWRVTRTAITTTPSIYPEAAAETLDRSSKSSIRYFIRAFVWIVYVQLPHTHGKLKEIKWLSSA